MAEELSQGECDALTAPLCRDEPTQPWSRGKLLITGENGRFFRLLRRHSAIIYNRNEKIPGTARVQRPGHKLHSVHSPGKSRFLRPDRRHGGGCPASAASRLDPAFIRGKGKAALAPRDRGFGTDLASPVPRRPGAKKASPGGRRALRERRQDRLAFLRLAASKRGLERPGNDRPGPAERLTYFLSNPSIAAAIFSRCRRRTRGSLA